MALAVPGVAGTSPIPSEEDASRPLALPLLPCKGRVPLPRGTYAVPAGGACLPVAALAATLPTPPSSCRAIPSRKPARNTALAAPASGAGLARVVPRGPVGLLAPATKLALPRPTGAKEGEAVAPFVVR